MSWHKLSLDKQYEVIHYLNHHLNHVDLEMKELLTMAVEELVLWSNTPIDHHFEDVVVEAYWEDA
jgi:hypothetical protein